LKSLRVALFLLLLSFPVLAGTNLDLASSTSYNIRLDGASDGDFAGSAVAAGDINGDGVEDLVVGANATDYTGLQAGSVYVVYGGAAVSGNIDLNAHYDARFDGGAAGDQLGSSVACGDVNGDGYCDILMGAYLADNSAADSGSVYLVYGSASLSGVKSLTAEANYSARFDGAVANANLGYSFGLCNVNGDTRSDLVLGAPRDGSGEAYLIYGPASFPTKVMTMSASAYYDARFIGATLGDRFGSTIALGDVNGDSQDDILVGAYLADNNGRTDSGSVYLINGAASYSPKDRSMSNASYYAARFDGAQSQDELGNPGEELGRAKSLAVGDVNGGGRADLVLGAHKAQSGAGSAYFISGEATLSGSIDLNSTTSYNYRFDGAASGDRLGTSVALGIINADSLRDLLLGAAYADNNSRTDSGSVYVIYGTSEGYATKVVTVSASANYALRFDGATDQDKLGYSLAAGDVNGDSSDDPIMGAFAADNNGRANSGSVYSYSGLVQPAITSVTPASKPQHWVGTIVVNGSNFVSGCRVSFNDSNILVYSTTFRSSTSIEARINILPATAVGAKNITVTNPAGIAGSALGVFSVTAGGNGPSFSGIQFTYNGTTVDYTGSTLTLPTYFPTVAGTITDSDGLTVGTVRFGMLIGTSEVYRDISSATDLTAVARTSGTFSYAVQFTAPADLVLYAEDVNGNPTQYSISLNFEQKTEEPIESVQAGVINGELEIQITANVDVADATVTLVGHNPCPIFRRRMDLRSAGALRAMGVTSGINRVRTPLTNLLGERIPYGVYTVLVTTNRVLAKQKIGLYPDLYIN